MRRVVAFLPLLFCGCYLIHLAKGQAHIRSSLRPIVEMLEDSSVPQATRDRLRLVLEIKEFGEHRMGLARTSNFTQFYDTGGGPVSYVVSASRPDRFEPHTWWFPIVGTVPYKGFFDASDARAEAEALREKGLDVSAGGVGAYSTLGWFTDPLLSTMLEYPEERLASLILHEMTHTTLWRAGQVEFNEGLADFVGEQGALEFVRWRFGTRSPVYGRAVRAVGSKEAADAEVNDLFMRLDDFYRSDAPSGKKLELRDVIAGRPVNNAEILSARRYGRGDTFRALFDRALGDWRRFFNSL